MGRKSLSLFPFQLIVSRKNRTFFSQREQTNEQTRLFELYILSVVQAGPAATAYHTHLNAVKKALLIPSQL